MSCGVFCAVLNPCTYLFALAHVLLLACLLCPASRLLNIDHGLCTDHRAWRRLNKLQWIKSSHPTFSRLCLAVLGLLVAEMLIPPHQQEFILCIHPICLSSSASLCLLSFPQPAYSAEILPSQLPIPRLRCSVATCLPSAFSRSIVPPVSKEPVSRALLGTNQSEQTNAQPFVLRRKLIIDSGASFHVHPHAEDLINLRPCNNRIMGIDHKPHICSSIGDFPVAARGEDGVEYNLLIKNVRCAPTFKDSLISINQLWLESKVDVSFKDICCLITPCGKRFPNLSTNQREQDCISGECCATQPRRRNASTSNRLNQCLDWATPLLLPL